MMVLTVICEVGISTPYADITSK